MPARAPPTNSPRNDAKVPAMMLNPSAVPRCDTGKASVRIAVELAMSIAPPTPWTSRSAMRTSAPLGPVTGENANPIDATVKTRKPALYIFTRPNWSPNPAERHDQYRRDDQVAEEQPEQVPEVSRGQRLQVDPPEDRGQRDDDDRLVQKRHERPERRVRQRVPLVALRVGDRPLGPGHPGHRK